MAVATFSTSFFMVTAIKGLSDLVAARNQRRPIRVHARTQLLFEISPSNLLRYGGELDQRRSGGRAGDIGRLEQARHFAFPSEVKEEFLGGAPMKGIQIGGKRAPSVSYWLEGLRLPGDLVARLNLVGGLNSTKDDAAPPVESSKP